jgi:hypothetical protein
MEMTFTDAWMNEDNAFSPATVASMHPASLSSSHLLPPLFFRYPFASFLLYICFFLPLLVVPSDNLKERRSNDNKEKEAQEDWPDCELRLPLVHIHLTTLRHILMKSCISMFQ